MTDHEMLVLQEMSAVGGSFVRALAQAMWKADGTNFKILKDTFKEKYWDKYEKIMLDNKERTDFRSNSLTKSSN